MLRTLWTSTASMEAASKRMDQISLNVANIGTNGYKKGSVEFKDLVYESLDRNGYPVSKDPSGSNAPITGTGDLAADPVIDTTQGELQVTGMKSDLAIDGEGYIKVKDPNNNTLYARVGSFVVDGMGRLVDSNQNILDINFSKGFNYSNSKFAQDNYTIKENGDVIVDNKGESQKVGTVDVFDAVGDNAFKYMGAGLYTPAADAQVFKTNKASIVQGSVEGSNVSLEQEETDMITTQRAFQLASKGLKTADDMWGMANNLRK